MKITTENYRAHVFFERLRRQQPILIYNQLVNNQCIIFHHCRIESLTAFLAKLFAEPRAQPLQFGAVVPAAAMHYSCLLTISLKGL